MPIKIPTYFSRKLSVVFIACTTAAIPFPIALKMFPSKDFSQNFRDLIFLTIATRQMIVNAIAIVIPALHSTNIVVLFGPKQYKSSLTGTYRLGRALIPGHIITIG